MLYTATLTIMSPSEVIIEVYIMPEDASFGALFLFQFKDPFLVFQGWREMSSNLFLPCGYTAWLLLASRSRGTGGSW